MNEYIIAIFGIRKQYKASDNEYGYCGNVGIH